jgi:hypothetical protein
MKHVMFFSGGMSSFISAKRLVDKYGKDNVILLFTDTNYEHEDLYRFLDETVAFLGAEYIRLADGRTPWDVFKDRRFLGNSQKDPCSAVLKRDLSRRWVKENCTPGTHTLNLGYGPDERHRLERSQKFWAPFVVSAPLIDELITKNDMMFESRSYGIEPPELYSLGFPHNNCGGFCVKAGHAHFLHLLRVLPEKYAEVEKKEEEMRELLGDVSILKDRRGGVTKPLTLKQLRVRERGDCDYLDWGGCGCFSPDEE